MVEQEKGPGRRVDRREFLTATAGLLAAAALPVGWAAAPAAASPALALSGERRAVYRDLVAALRHAPTGRLAGRDVTTLTEEFAAWYAAQDAGTRTNADAILDGVAPVIAGRRSPAQRLERIARPPGGASPSRAEARRRALTVASLGLVTSCLDADADADDGDRVPAAALVA